MNLLAVLLALWIERVLTRRMQLREARWLDGYYDQIARILGRARGVGARAAALAAVLLPMLPVAVVAWLLRGRLYGLPGFLFALAVLLACFGPRNLREEVDDYRRALAAGDHEAAMQRANALLEHGAEGSRGRRPARLDEAMYVQANNRLFGVLFWFVLAGPAGAWAFRASDLLRRRAVFEAARRGADPQHETFGDALLDVHGMLGWLPARLAGFACLLAGRNRLSPPPVPLPAAADPTAAAALEAAWRVVRRALWIWVFALALLTLAGLVA